jgi:Uma2 family endonuclease
MAYAWRQPSQGKTCRKNEEKTAATRGTRGVADANAIRYVLSVPTQTQHRFSVEEYYRMGETGVLRPDARVELLDGQIIDMSPIGPSHGSVVKRLIDLFHHSQGRWLLAVQDPVHLDNYSEPQPDLMLLKRVADFYHSRHPGPEDVLLLIEVSDSTLESDRETKVPAYARAGIAEVWIVDLVNETLEVYREPNFTGYSSAKILHPGDQASPARFPDAVIAVAELFDRL